MNIFPKHIPNPTTDKCVIILVFQKKIYVDIRKRYNYQKIVLYLWCNILTLMRYDSKNLCGQFVPFEGFV